MYLFTDSLPCHQVDPESRLSVATLMELVRRLFRRDEWFPVTQIGYLLEFSYQEIERFKSAPTVKAAGSVSSHTHTHARSDVHTQTDRQAGRHTHTHTHTLSCTYTHTHTRAGHTHFC